MASRDTTLWVGKRSSKGRGDHEGAAVRLGHVGQEQAFSTRQRWRTTQRTLTAMGAFSQVKIDPTTVDFSSAMWSLTWNVPSR
jgi:hypothetical protein